MQNSPVLLTAILAGLLVGIVGVSGGGHFAARPRVWAGVIVILPAAATLSLFFSLAAHMHSTLGAWPESLGTAGFPDALATHVYIAQLCFGIVLASTLFALPVVALLCWLVPRGRSWQWLIGIHGIACSVCFGATFLAPSGFLYWWWD